MHHPAVHEDQYAEAMGRLLVLYTEVDQFIMEACANRLASAPDQEAKMGLAKQVGDECRHVLIQTEWMRQFGVARSPVIAQPILDELHEDFRQLDWFDYLVDLYLVIEALGSQAVEQIVPLADPGTRESLRIPLQDEIDHVTFGMSQLKEALAAMEPAERRARLEQIPTRIQRLLERLQGLDLPVIEWFDRVGASYPQLCSALDRRRAELLTELAA
ncbi:MAG: ferritin-like domain-containing protein [Gammaproteobacteria bacterium]|jgi:hypothetical protein